MLCPVSKKQNLIPPYHVKVDTGEKSETIRSLRQHSNCSLSKYKQHVFLVALLWRPAHLAHIYTHMTDVVTSKGQAHREVHFSQLEKEQEF